MKRFRETMIANALAARNRSGGGVVPVTLPISQSGDPFIVKYSLTGLAEWAKSFRANTSSDSGNAVAVDSTGLYVAGNYSSASNISLGNGVTLPTSVSSDAFIVKYDVAGVAQWATGISATSSIDSASGIAVDPTGVYVVGRYSNSTSLSLGNGVTLPASVNLDAFIIKYNLAGIAQWANTVSGSEFDYGNAVAVDSTGVYVGGQYTSTSIVSLGNGVTLPISDSEGIIENAFTAKYNLTGVAQWATTVSGTGGGTALSFALDSTGLYVGGQYDSTSTVSLGNGVTLPISVGRDAFIIKYNLAGVAQWATGITSEETNNEAANALAVDSTGVYVAGRYSNSTSLSLGNGVTLPASVGLDAFIIKYNLSNVAQWATAISGTGSDNAIGLAVDSTGMYVTGSYISTSNVSLGNGVTLPISRSGTDAFTAKYNLSGVAQWATVLRGSSNDFGRGIAVDSTGVYVVGQYGSSNIITIP